ncbi:hypothetical protein [Geminocystis sp. GBBB08]|uniref:hypothetical protein n=1 Tax=Geminocystis sp. GBBB08 TaxID=2604140 RepID=UPI0027E31AF1|nr:hypothetical protein [Geminocystis sp. GBBB08]MBL1210283.1 hypothetical protein [Geminocystis sp. GBBB08]
MKIIIWMLLIISTFMVGCDANSTQSVRQTLEGLNLKINAEIKSDYDKEKKASEEIKKAEEESTSTSTEKAEVKSDNESQVVDQKASEKVEDRTENDEDKPMAFKEITECSKAGITAKTNEIFYAENSQVKSIDSKNEKQLKAWKKIYGEVEKDCNN